MVPSETSVGDASMDSGDATPSCTRDADCVIATDWHVCGACPAALPVDLVDADPCIGPRRPDASLKCAVCKGNEDCGLMSLPTEAQCVVDESAAGHCMIADHDEDGGAAP